MTTPDIRVGDLVKATRKDDPEVTASGRVERVDAKFVDTSDWGLHLNEWDFEVLDRPLPEIPEGVLEGATRAYADKRRLFHVMDDPQFRDSYLAGIRAAINYYLENTTKENA